MATIAVGFDIWLYLALNEHKVTDASVITLSRSLRRFPKNFVGLFVVGRTSDLIAALIEVMMTELDCQHQSGRRRYRLRTRRRPYFAADGHFRPELA